MTWQAVVLAAVGSLQVILLAWIAAWQARAAHEVRKLNGHVEQVLRVAVRELQAEGRSSGGTREGISTSES